MDRNEAQCCLKSNACRVPNSNDFCTSILNGSLLKNQIHTNKLWGKAKWLLSLLYIHKDMNFAC